MRKIIKVFFSLFIVSLCIAKIKASGDNFFEDKNLELSDFQVNYNSETFINLFSKYCSFYKKSYCSNQIEELNLNNNFIFSETELSEEVKSRFEIFSENLEKLIKHNSNPQRLYDVKLTRFSDMTKEEVAEKLLDFNLKANQELKFLNNVYSNKAKVDNLPLSEKEKQINNSVWANIDWRSKNILNEIRNQGDCGGCWAFSVVGTVEALVNIKKGRINPHLSVQQLIDCDSQDKGCKGGWAPNALKYIARTGVVSDSDYPYEEKNAVCKSDLISDPSNIKAKIDSNFVRCEEDECKQGEFNYNLLKNGPVSVVIDAYNTNFYNYKNGYYNESCSEPNHAVILVGFGYDAEKNVKYWIIRNSWGSDWGMNGYGYVKYDENNYWSCNLGRYAFQPKIIN